MRVLITGGAGFVGSRLGHAFIEPDHAEVWALDNLKRRGSELNINPMRDAGIRFVHGDIRIGEDLQGLPGNFDVMIEASAEPSVAAGYHDSPAYVIATNLGGTLNCLEFARRRCGSLLFLSTSRVYSITSLRSIRLEEQPSRYEIAAGQNLPGINENGINEDFPTNSARSFYGATKLASELMIQEYVEQYGLKAIIDRCGVIAGPGQFGKVDQGVFTMWVAYHYLGIPLRYTGFGGKGKQVRDLLHPADLVELLRKQLTSMDTWRGEIFNVGGSRSVSVSLREMTDLCRNIVGRETQIDEVAETAPYDMPLYLTDITRVSTRFSWAPQKKVPDIVAETAKWIRDQEQVLQPLFSRGIL